MIGKYTCHGNKSLAFVVLCHPVVGFVPVCFCFV